MKYICYTISMTIQIPFFPQPFNVGIFGFCAGIMFASVVLDYFEMKYH